MVYFLNLLSGALVPLLLAAIGAHLAAPPIAGKRRRIVIVIWGLTAAGIVIFGVSQYLAYRADKNHAAEDKEFHTETAANLKALRNDVDSRLDQILQEKNLEKVRQDAEQLKAELAWHTEDEKGIPYANEHSFDPACIKSGTSDDSHHCAFKHSQLDLGGNTRTDEWSISYDAPGPVYSVQCIPTAAFEWNKVKGDPTGEFSGNKAFCSGFINGGDGDIVMKTKWKQRW